jgi:glutamyl-tRNA synthetase
MARLYEIVHRRPRRSLHSTATGATRVCIRPTVGDTVGVAGRFAPSPTGDLHLGNLRTAAIAWLSARARGARFVVRMEDLDPHQSSVDHEAGQLRDLVELGIDWDGDVVRQSDRFERYDAAIDDLAARGLVYECFCSRREIRDQIASASHAPHGPPGSYPGTCRRLTERERSARRDAGRHPALRLRTDNQEIVFPDRVHGSVSGVVDDVVLRRNDGVPAYNLAVVVDDAAQGIDEVVRGDDLLSSTARQIHLQELLGYARPMYAHVPLVVDAAGERLAKRHGLPLTITELAEVEVGARDVVDWIAQSLGHDASHSSVTLQGLVDGFDVTTVPRHPCPLPRFARAR